MTEWQVVGVIVVLVGLVISIMTPTLKYIKSNTEATTRLAVSVEKLGKDLETFSGNNRDAHKELYNKLENHETRITVLEERK